MTLKFDFRRVYGRTKFYPIDAVSKAFLETVDKRCLSGPEMIKILRLIQCGVSVEVSESGEVMPISRVVEILSE